VTRERPIRPSAADAAGRSRATRRKPLAQAAPEREAARPWLGWVVGAAAVAALAYGALREGPEREATASARDGTAPSRRNPPRRERLASQQGTLRPSAPPPEAGGPLDGTTLGGLRWDAGSWGGELDPGEPSPPAPEAPTEPAATRGDRVREARADAGPRHPPLPPGHPALDEPAAPPEEAPEEPGVSIIRRLDLTVIRRWQQPGLCQQANRASAARRVTMSRFRRVDWPPDALLFLDPRLFRSTQKTLLESLEVAEREIAEQLAIRPSRPDVFAYRDTALLLAGSCANDGVVAYYDGNLHVVATHADVQESITHEYTHHALMTAGLIGPAWAQEGIAMNVARETWWQTPEWLERVAAQPFSLEVMERTVPYTMSSEEALSFYVQAGAMVRCAILAEPEGLRGLVQRLRAGAWGGSLEYELPPLADPSALGACVRALSK
jgi:hypothetical protein